VLDPRLPAYNNLAVALERTGATDEAVEADLAAVRLTPDEASTETSTPPERER
jgi:hypothetical protein